MQDCTEAPGEDRAEEFEEFDLREPESAQHTELPWQELYLNSGSMAIETATGEDTIALLQGPNSAANANLIVRAVNSHYGLLDTLRDLLWKLEHFDEFEVPERNAFVENAPIHIRAAIAKAEGRGNAD